MKKLHVVLALLTLTASAHARTVRLFVIGNSFSGNATKYLPQLAKAGGHELAMKKAEIGGCPLQKHWALVEADDKNEPAGKAYGGKSLRELLSSGTWDVVTMQQYSMHSGDIETYRPHAAKLNEFVKKLQPQAEIAMHQTWAYRADAKAFSNIAGGKKAQTNKEMWENSRAAYRTIAAELGARLLPVGDAFWKVSADPQWGFKKDEIFDAKTAIHPALPDQKNSLHNGYSWNKTKITFDANHANDAGCYLGGLVWYAVLFDESPEKLTYAPTSLSPEFAAYLRKVAWETVLEGKAEKKP